MIKGSCLCGAISYEIHGTPQGMYYCHCSMCRKASGSTFATNMLVQKTDFVLKSGISVLKAYQSSAGESRYFCSQCGSPIYSEAEVRQNMVSVRCGGLDEAPPGRPTEHIYVGSKAPWFDVCDQLPQHLGEPESERS